MSVYTGRLFLPPLSLAERHSFVTAPQLSPTERPDCSGKAQTAEPFHSILAVATTAVHRPKDPLRKDGASSAWLKPTVSAPQFL